MNHRTTVLPLVVAALLGAAACTSSTPGNGAPATAGNTQSGGPTSNGSGLASIQPCDLISSDIASQNQLGTPATDNGPGSRGCTWHNTTANNGDGYVVGTDIRDNQGIKDVNTGGFAVTTDNIGDHPGRQLQSTQATACIVAIGVTNSSRVDVTVTGGTDANQACQLANQYAKLIESNLPAASG